MNGRLAKTYGAEKAKYDPKSIYTVSIMPCVAKKYEGLRKEYAEHDLRDIDATLTTRELAYMIRQAGIDFNKLRQPHGRIHRRRNHFWRIWRRYGSGPTLRLSGCNGQAP